ncbi:unnamed protein product, partial [Oppiella nova]
ELALSRQRITILRQHPFYHLEVHLVCATNLLAKDTCGTSDPYVKFKIGNKIVYKSRIVNKCLDPKWDEYFVIPIEDVFQPVLIKAYDYDFGFQDDFLGATSIDLTKLDLQHPTDLHLALTESGLEADTGAQSWGEIFLTVTLIAKTQEEKEMHFSRGTKTVSVGSGGETAVKKLKTQLWDSVVNIVDDFLMIKEKRILGVHRGKMISELSTKNVFTFECLLRVDFDIVMASVSSRLLLIAYLQCIYCRDGRAVDEDSKTNCCV